MFIRMLTVLAVLLPCAHVAAQATRPAKKVIEFGWDEPTTAYMKQHIAEMEKRPFDGCVFHINYTMPDGTNTGRFMNECWGKRAFTDAELAASAAELRSTPLKRFTHNFLRFNVLPGDVDWFDDFSPILNNARQSARIAREGKAAGVLFDIEMYAAQLFNYAEQRDAKTKSFEQYAKQSRRRGREVMEAFQKGFPDLHVLLTFGHSLPLAQTREGKQLSEVSYGLLAPFLDGMYEAAKGKAKIIDGFEISYGYKDPTQFDEARATVHGEPIRAVMGVDPKTYERFVSLGFGLWMDYDWRKYGWDTKDFAKNHFTPEQFRQSAEKALATADEYVWIYTETPRWWGEDGKPVKLPEEYERALREASRR